MKTMIRACLLTPRHEIFSFLAQNLQKKKPLFWGMFICRKNTKVNTHWPFWGLFYSILGYVHFVGKTGQWFEYRPQNRNRNDTVFSLNVWSIALICSCLVSQKDCKVHIYLVQPNCVQAEWFTEVLKMAWWTKKQFVEGGINNGVLGFESRPQKWARIRKCTFWGPFFQLATNVVFSQQMLAIRSESVN